MTDKTNLGPVEKLFEILAKNPPTGTFNPWHDVDPEHDKNENAPIIRRRHLSYYLKNRKGKARILLLGEALGYQGGHFSGIAMTSERILLGKTGYPELDKLDILGGIPPERTSKTEVKKDGFTEPTATIVWRYMLSRGFEPEDFLIWNIFPWHPYKGENLLSNRTPKTDEVRLGYPALKILIQTFGFRRIAAVGNKAAEALEVFGIPFDKVRHPANGGAKKFAEQMDEILVRLKSGK